MTTFKFQCWIEFFYLFLLQYKTEKTAVIETRNQNDFSISYSETDIDHDLVRILSSSCFNCEQINRKFIMYTVVDGL